MSCATGFISNPAVGPESSRLILAMEDARQCAILQALKRTRSNNPCVIPVRVSGPDVPRSSTLTATKTACMTYKSVPCGPESARIASLQRATLDASTGLGAARFSAYARRLPPPVCQDVPQEALNANVPRMQGLRCPLPNRSDLIVLPG